MDPPLFYFGAMSPYSWFAAERIGGLLPEAVWCPVFAGGLFKANRRESWGLGEARAAGLADCEQRARHHGLGPIRWPAGWPTNDLLIARAMIFAQPEGAMRELALAAMRMAFLEGADLGEREVVLEAGRRVGIDPARLDAGIEHPSTKESLRAATGDAVARGAFGVPTVVVGTRMFWGDDRLDEAAQAHQTLRVHPRAPI